MHRKQNVLAKAFVFLILTSFAATLSSCSKDLIYFPKSIQEEVDKTLDNGYDGIIVCVNQNGQSKLYTSGWNNREDQIPADPHLLFKIASISKLYIAAATVKLIQDEQLSLNQTLAELIPEVADKIEYADEFIYHPEFANSDPEESYLETANLIFNNDADFKPGKKYRYSNTNYLLIGEILDRTLGYSHHDYIKSEILQPLHLENTYNLLSEVDSSRVMSGYYVGYDEDLKMNDYTRPGGSMIATAEDVSIFLRALIDGSLLNEQEQAIYSSVYEYEHTGWLNGYTSIARYENDIDAVIVQFVNTSKGEMFWLGLERSYSRILKAVRK
jgi:CubicO group peptidase (beta-lactamase class C family)